MPLTDATVSALRAVLTPAEIHQLLLDDAPHGDLTTLGLGIGRRSAEMCMSARGEMVVCGVEEAMQLAAALGLQAESRVRSGALLKPGDEILEFEGPALPIFEGWKVMQTLMEWMSGIASATAEIVSAARAVDPTAVVACTRKTPPLSRRLAVKAVLAGGGTMHRLGLSETVLLFPEHRRFAADLGAAIARLRQAAPEKRIVVEVGDEAEALAAVAAGADVLQLEKMAPPAVARVCQQLLDHPAQPLVAATGGVNAGNAADHVRAGARLLVTSAPYWARPRDVSVRITPSD